MYLNKYIVDEGMSVYNTMHHIEENMRGIVFVCKNRTLIGSVTDGDIRRHILANGNLEVSVIEIMTKSPHYLYLDQTDIDYRSFMEENYITALPIVDHDMNVVRIEFVTLRTQVDNTAEKINVPVVIMAGGKGSRLKPYTQILPKPLIPVGDLTITEHIMNRFEKFGCRHFEMIVNYKKNLIKSFFIDSEQERDICFIEEENYYGTAGGLKLLESKMNSTFFMTNCDILIDENYSKILKYHQEQKNIITLVCAMKNLVIPYGVIHLSPKGQVAQLEEKPNFHFITNTGLYVIEPEFLLNIPENTFIHITEVIQKCIDANEKVGIYPVSDNAWMDMGQVDELKSMKEKMEQ